MFKPRLCITINFEVVMIADSCHVCGKEQYDKVIAGYEPSAADLKNRGNQLYQAKQATALSVYKHGLRVVTDDE